MQFLWIFVLIFTGLSHVQSLYDSSDRVKVVKRVELENILKVSKHISVVEFFAPWCGYCKQFAPIYKMFAGKVSDFINVIAVDCDDQENGPLCQTYNVKGFPTVKIIIPGKNGLRIEDYQGSRTYSDLMNKVSSEITDYTAKISTGVDLFLNKRNGKAKLLLFTSKKTPNAFFKVLSMEFQDYVSFGLIHESYKEAVQIFNISKFPSIVLVFEEGKDSIFYSGETTYRNIFNFLEKYVKVEKKEETAPETKKDFTLIELQSVNEFLEKCITGHGFSIIGISSSPSNFDFLKKIAKKHNKFKYFFIDSSKKHVNTISEILELQFEELKVILVNGKKRWYVELVENSEEKLLELISRITLGDKIEKKKLNEKVIQSASESKKEEL
ncbi:uncharacterized protein T551_03482 [Pneumocystis jirovecii RU7]|uniref:protein disulfide-isomerase n=1 Tax=Pneumocystis jirovecii (strain RU7) TaxID=1408657 RepID=A0A0W4ZDZ6_PNEJ7|nr:uncharacterized protein T551_03482 [Pneumocystis jirovecii RU7]KTW26565.1 hypothetical protein T551_03482 [Pneumocystis jirovecii RU7]